MDKRILIYGWAKSGTTALFYKLRETFGAFNVQEVFEPHGPFSTRERRFKRVLLVKALWGGLMPADFDSYRCFDKKIWLARDPRDFLISMYLYHWESQRENPGAIDRVLAALRQKEQDPTSWPVHRLCEDPAIGFGSVCAKSLQIRLAQTVEFLKAHRDEIQLFRYEDMVANQWDNLEQYLGQSISGEARVPRHALRVVRSKRARNWMHWFTPEDVEYYRPIASDFLEFMGLPDDWELAERPHIDPLECSGYVERLVRGNLSRQG